MKTQTKKIKLFVMAFFATIAASSFALATEKKSCEPEKGEKVIAPFRTEAYSTTKDCSKLKVTGYLNDDYEGYILSEIKCNGESYSIIKLLRPPGYTGSGIYTVKSNNLIKQIL